MADLLTMPPKQPSQQDDSAEEVTIDNPLTEEQEKAQLKAQKDEEDALKAIRARYKQSWSSKRQIIVRRILKSFEYLKNNPYSVYNMGTGEYGGLGEVLAGNMTASDEKLYQYNDNIFQMLCLSFMAALGPDVNKTRWMPDDPQKEGDLSFQKKASTMMAFIERMNDMSSLQNLKLLYLFCCGTYFVYTRNTVDAVRAGTTKTPIMEMQPQEVFPDRYLCSSCGNQTAAKNFSPFQNPSCSSCQQPLSQQDFYPSVSMPMPVQVGENEQANSITALDVFCGLNVDMDPSAESIAKTPILDLLGEMDYAAVRASYPSKYKQITGGLFSDASTGETGDRLARERVSSPGTSKGMNSEEQNSTFSRCWIQPYAFDSLEDDGMAKRLKEKYPKGVKLVMFGEDLVLEVRQESLLEKWTEGRTIKGLGMYPFGVGDVAISVQDRVDDTANNIHIYQDRMALPPVLANAMLVDAAAMGRQRMGGGRVIPVYPSLKGQGMGRWNMSDALWQPTFHADNQIYTYSNTLMTLMQLLTGIQPQIFGGGTSRGVDTASGQNQQLNTAMGRLMLFLTSMRSECARTAKLAVKAMAADIDDQKRITVDGAVEGQYDNAFILQSEVQGEVHAYPQSDQGFPATYGEMRDRLIQILGMVEKNPVLQNMLSDPDMQKLLALYLLPDGAKLPGDAERTKIKMVLEQLANDPQGPQATQDPASGETVVMPTIQPDPDFDDMGMIVQIAKDWAQTNYELATSKPLGYANVRAYLKLASQMNAVNQAKDAAIAAAGQPGGAPGAGGPPAAAAA